MGYMEVQSPGMAGPAQLWPAALGLPVTVEVETLMTAEGHLPVPAALVQNAQATFGWKHTSLYVFLSGSTLLRAASQTMCPPASLKGTCPGGQHLQIPLPSPTVTVGFLCATPLFHAFPTISHYR